MSKPICILYCNDSPDDRALVRNTLENEGGDFMLLPPMDPPEFEKHLARGDCDILLTGLKDMGSPGVQVLQAVRARAPGLPVIIVASEALEEQAVEGLRQGAADYVINSAVRIRRLPHTIRNVVKAYRQRRALISSTARHARQAKQTMLMTTAVPYGLALLDDQGRILVANPLARNYLAALTGKPHTDVVTHLGEHSLAELSEVQAISCREPAGNGTYARVFEVMMRGIGNDGVTGQASTLQIREITQEHEIRQKAEQQERLAAVGQLAAGIAHDFNNILAAITGYAELLQVTCDVSQEAKRSLGAIQKQGFRAAELVRQILDFSRQSVSRKSPINLIPFCKETAKLLQRTIPENISIQVDYEPGDYAIMGDPGQLQQILMNLAVNARDAMPDGGRLDIRIAPFKLHCAADAPIPGMAPGQWLLLSVSDTGTGIAPEHTNHIFEPYFTTKREAKGTGLGLAQVYGLVRQHDGFIEVATKPGEGSTFLIYLPPASGDTAALAAVPQAPALETLVGRGEGILLVEDDPSVRGLIRALLEKLGYRVMTADNGRAGLEIYMQRQGEIDLVLMDWVMPQMDGAKLYQALKAFDADVRMLVMSGYPLGEGSKTQLAQAGVRWLQKPVQFAALSEAVRQALENQRPRPVVQRKATRDAALKIILLEDSAVDAQIIELELRQAGLDFSLDRVETRDGFVSAVERKLPDIILSDYRLPLFDGLTALRIARKRWPEVPFIFVSGKLGEEMSIETLKLGATDYVLKERISRLVPAVRRALDEAQERKALRRAEERSRHRFKAMRGAYEELQQAYDATIQSWCRALDERNRMSAGHTERVAGMTLQLAKAFGVSPAEEVQISRGAMLHEIGMMAVPDAILQKPGPLDSQEWDIMRRHPAYAYEWLAAVDYLRPALEIPYCHHERWDGSGYPRGLAGEQIPFQARLFAVVEVWETMRSERPFREALPDHKAKEFLKKNAGTLFDPMVVKRFLEQCESMY